MDSECKVVDRVRWVRRAHTTCCYAGGRHRPAPLTPSTHRQHNTNRANLSLARALRPDNFCADSSGRANNWAMGFGASLRELERGEGLFHSGGLLPAAPPRCSS